MLLECTQNDDDYDSDDCWYNPTKFESEYKAHRLDDGTKRRCKKHERNDKGQSGHHYV